MDTIIKKQVKDEVERRLQGASSTVAQTKPKRKIETRLSNLLTKIRKGNPSNESKKCIKKAHLKYKRYDSTKETEYLVPQKNGGGFKFASIDISKKLIDLQIMALNLFFPNGINKFDEYASNCEITFTDAAGNIIDTQSTLEKYLNDNGVYLSRTYFVLHSKEIVPEMSNLDDIFGNLHSTNVLPASDSNLEVISEDSSTSSNSAISLCNNSSTSQINVVVNNTPEEDVTCVNETERMVGDYSALTENYNYNDNSEEEQRQFDIDTNNFEQNELGTIYSVINLESYDNQIDGDEQLTENVPPTEEDADNISLADTIPIAPDMLHINPNPVNANLKKKIITIHRLNIKDDVKNAFKHVEPTDVIIFKIIDIHGNEEEGEGKGVNRDIYTSIWREILDSLFIGAQERVPLIRHDLFFEEWQAVGNVLLHGFQSCKYFPIALSKAFMMYALFGNVSNDILIESFLNYLSISEAEVVNAALKGRGNNIFEDEYFLDTLDRFNCRSKVCALNVYAIILELAKQELIQKPYIMVCTWQKVMVSLQKFKEFSSSEAVIEFYNNAKPNTKKVLKLLKSDPKNDSERDCIKYLERYIRCLDLAALTKFMCFTTGSNIISVESIQIDFIKIDGLARRPIAHTCGPVLELSSTYRNFCELREEFQNVIENFRGTDMI